MANNDNFLRQTAQDYDMAVEQVEYIARHYNGDEFYEALEAERQSRSKSNQPPLQPK
ncbi:hypothetical protein [uncultured Psychrobacter sp.]|uniref:hypothetical protein n=1 Tax=uncultured Psychrobacter sp. TaxID=259303 RepID=UPI00262B16B3|nr:hypothetical protein [uncultured Psychrobacter sp.]